MLAHLRANSWLLILTLLLCSGLYPLCLWCLGQGLFSSNAQGSVLTDEHGKTIGSRLIAQEFKGDEYFQPRPSSTGGKPYNAMASGASNLAASNYQLRDRVARALGPIVCYGREADKDGKKPGDPVGPDVEKWFQQDRYQGQAGIAAKWASLHPGVAENWVKDTDGDLKAQWKVEDRELAAPLNFLKQLQADHPSVFEALAPELKNLESATPADVARALFPLLSRRHGGQWLVTDELEGPSGEKRKKLVLAKESSDIQGIFFDMWRQEHPLVSLEEVPADLVLTSASGLDPHITQKNAEYQLTHRIARTRADKIVRDRAQADFITRALGSGGVMDKTEQKAQSERARTEFTTLSPEKLQPLLDTARAEIEQKLAGKNLEALIMEQLQTLIAEQTSAPLGGLAGVPLVNVLELNLATDTRLRRLLEGGK